MIRDPARALLIAVTLMLGPALGARGQEPGERTIQRVGHASGTAIPGRRWAVIVGISAYKSVKSLHWAAADAEAMYRYVRASGVPDSQVVRLYDSSATRGSIMRGIRWLVVHVRPGDEAVFYFAGHGGVEDSVLNERAPAYLLAYDTQANNQGAAEDFDDGGVSLDHLKDYVSTMADRGVHVVVIADACRDGALVTDQAHTTATITQLERLNTNATIMVSTGAGQVSYEDAKWGGGHGVFTWFLLQGLEHPERYAAPGDSEVKARNLMYYVTNQVDRETNSHQTPDIEGYKDLLLAVVRPADGRGNAPQRPPQHGGPKALSFEFYEADRLGSPSVADSVVEREVRALRAAIAAGALLTPKGASAWDAYERLTRLPAARSVLPDLRNDLQAALQGGAEGTIRIYLSGPNELPRGSDFLASSDEMRHALRLLEPRDPERPTVQARATFLWAYAVLREKERTRYGEAADSLRKAIRLEPYSAYAHNALGVIYLQRNQFQQAVAEFQRATVLAPNWIYPRENLGTTLAAERRYAEATTAYERAQDVDSLSGELYNAWGNVESDLGRYRRAEELYRKAIRLAPGRGYFYGNLGSLYRQRGLYGRARALLDSANAYARTDAQGPLDIWPAIQSGLLFVDQSHDYPSARAALAPALASAPFYPEPLTYLGDFYREEGINDSAEIAYRRAIRLDSLYAPAYDGLALTLENQKRLREAENSLLTAARRIPHAPEPINNLANYCVRRWWEAASDSEAKRRLDRRADSLFHAALAKDSLFLPAYYDWADFDVKRGIFVAAESLYTRATTVEVMSPDALRRLGDFYSHADFYSQALMDSAARETWLDRAEAAYRRAIALDSTFAGALDALGTLELWRHRFAEAVGFFRRAADLGFTANTRATYSAAARHVGELLLANRPDLALVAYRAALELDPLNHEARTEMGQVLYVTGRDTEALAIVDSEMGATRDNRARLQALRALVLLDLGRAGEALEIIRPLTSPESEPSPLNLLTLAIAHVQLGHPDSAMTAYRRAVDLRPDVRDRDLRRENFSPSAVARLARLDSLAAVQPPH